MIKETLMTNVQEHKNFEIDIVVGPETDLVEEMDRETEDTIEVIFQEIIQSKKSHGFENSIYCFYEGKDDFKYYPNKIRDFLDLIHCEKGVFDRGCESKENVINLYTKILLDCEDIVESSLFFVDRDFSKESNLGDNFYVTPGYSIENLYADENVLDRFLVSNCHIGNRSIEKELDDYNKIKEFYKTSLEFQVNELSLINAWYSCQVNNAVQGQLPNLNKLKSISSIRSNSGCSSLSDITLEKLKSITGNYIEIPEETIIAERLELEKDLINNTRGKYIEEILLGIYKKIIEECNTPDEFELSQRKISFQVGKKNFKTLFQPYVITPSRLIEYLKNKIN